MLYEALLLETKGRAARTELMLFAGGQPGDLDAPNNLQGMLQKFAEAWDPKKSKPTEAATGPKPGVATQPEE